MEPFAQGDTNVARIIHQANKVATDPAASLLAPYDATASSTAIAPSVPPEVHEKAKKQAFQLSNKIRATITDPTLNPADALDTAAGEWLATLKSTESPLTTKARTKSLADWASYLLVKHPDMSTERHWDRDVVEQNYQKFLFTMVTHTQPRSNKKTIKASTVAWWCSLFLHSIVVYTRDPDTHQKCGMALLIKHGVYQELKNQVVQLVHTFKLDRHRDTRLYYGRNELQLIFNVILEDSEKTGRQVAIQNIVRHSFPFYFTTRASSLGTATGVEQNFRITGVEHAHNALFDLTVSMLAHLFLAKRFVTKYEASCFVLSTPAELFADTSAELQIDPAFMDTPLFLETAPGGREFASPEKAAMSNSAYNAFRYACERAGLPRAGYTAMRRETGNVFGLQFGARVAKDALNHTSDGPYRDSYSRSTANYDFIAVRLGEKRGTEESAPGEILRPAHPSQENHIKNAFTSAAVECLVRRAQETSDVEEEEEEAKKEYKKKLVDSPSMKPLHEARTAAWEAYIKCFNDTAKGYQSGTPQANKLLKLADGSMPPPRGESIPVEFKRGWNTRKATPLRDAFIAAEQAFLKQQKKEMRLFKSKKKNDENQRLISGPLTGTSDERALVVEILASNPTTEHLQQAVKDATARAAAPANSDLESVRIWASNIQKAQTAIALLDAEDEPASVEQQKHQDAMFAYFDRMTLSPAVPEIPRGEDAALDDENDDGPLPEGPDVDEASEQDILNIPITEIRRALFEYYVQPVMAARAYEKFKVTEAAVAGGAQAGYKCPRCALYLHLDPVPDSDPTFATISKFERHILYRHSEWDDLELDMVKTSPDAVLTYRCPAGDFEDAESVEQVRNHLLSDCIQSKVFLKMAQIREDTVPKDIESRSFKDKRAGRSNRANRINVLDYDSEDDVEDSDAAPADLNTQWKDLMELSAGKSGVEPDDAKVLTNYLAKYIDDAGNLVAVKKGIKVPGVEEWEALGLDELV
ncbi:hypothetical protein DFH09DRAFT_1276193 [Mycena vulgaris]|nr:hypothetical protein DFH09DRAFT_1276193 [Mycena vulgaris]